MEAVGNYYKTVYEIACQRDLAKRSQNNKAQVVKEFLNANPTDGRPVEEYLSAVVWARIHYLQVEALSKNASFEEEENGGWYCPCLRTLYQRRGIRRSSEQGKQL
jgi:hypothetical protein